MESEQKRASGREVQSFFDFLNLLNPHLLNLYSRGLLAMSLILLPGFFGISRFDAAAFISLYSFSLAIPMLVACFVVTSNVN